MGASGPGEHLLRFVAEALDQVETCERWPASDEEDGS